MLCCVDGRCTVQPSGTCTAEPTILRPQCMAHKRCRCCCAANTGHWVTAARWCHPSGAARPDSACCRRSPARQQCFCCTRSVHRRAGSSRQLIKHWPHLARAHCAAACSRAEQAHGVVRLLYLHANARAGMCTASRHSNRAAAAERRTGRRGRTAARSPAVAGTAALCRAEPWLQIKEGKSGGGIG